MPVPHMRDWLDALEVLYAQHGYVLAFVGALAENTALVGLLLPGNTLALLAGFYAREGTLSLPWVIVLSWWGMVLGYQVDYLVGRFVLGRLVHGWAATRLGRRLRLAGRLRLAQRFLARHGGKAILLSHAVGHLRSFVALSAGLSRMRYWPFLAFEVVAALLWSTAICLAGYLLGGERERLELLLERSGWVVLAVGVLLAIAWRLLAQWQRQRRQRRRGRRPRAAFVVGAARKAGD